MAFTMTHVILFDCVLIAVRASGNTRTFEGSPNSFSVRLLIHLIHVLAFHFRDASSREIGVSKMKNNKHRLIIILCILS